MNNRTLLRAVFLLFLCFFLFLNGVATQAQTAAPTLTLSRPVRAWEFMPAVGQKAALLGHENGTVEAWVYPMKLFRDFSLVFHVGDREIPAASLVRTIEVHPEAVTLVYSGDTFSVRETFFAPRDEPGAVIAIEITTFETIEVEARFHRDFQLMWPASTGGTYANWEEKLHAFTFGEEQKKWFGMVGSATATGSASEFDTNYYSDTFDSFRLGPTTKGSDRKLIVMAGSVVSRQEMEATYKRLGAQYDTLRTAAAEQYTNYLDRTTSLSLPDSQLQQAYDWSRVSVLQGLVANPFLGTGLVAGYRTSGASGRPGYAWFFGRDSEWTSFALNSTGDFETTRTALDFLSKYQRQDGKVPHEISQAAKQVPWFTAFPYAWASADATPLFIIAVRDYYEHSGDSEFVNLHWDNVWRAYQFLRSTWDAHRIPQNFGIGHGWVEGGPLLPVKSEFYQSGLGAESLNALATLARVAGKNDVATEGLKLFTEQQSQLNDLFWNPEGHFFSFAIDQQDRPVKTPTVLTTVPMWFGITDSAKSDSTITGLADADHSTDWGMRIISSRDPRYDPSGYHFGSVWPLFTGWASVAEYRYHRPFPAYENLRANALLALDGSAGHTTEVLSGSFFEQLSTSSPHQVWSAAMVVSPILRGLLGIDASVTQKRITVAPHLPSDWTWWKAHNVRIGNATVDLAYHSGGDAITLDASGTSANGTTLQFSPSLSPRAIVLGAEVNGRSAKFEVQKNGNDQHVMVNVPLTSVVSTIRIRIQDDFGLAIEQTLPQLGQPSRNLKVISETWTASKDAVTYELAGISGMTYTIGARGTVATVEGAELSKDRKALRVAIPAAGEPGYRHMSMTIHFPNRR
jgi:glycogen debranching enzyme